MAATCTQERKVDRPSNSHLVFVILEYRRGSIGVYSTYSLSNICLSGGTDSNRIGWNHIRIPTVRRALKRGRVGELYRSLRIPVVARIGEYGVNICGGCHNYGRAEDCPEGPK